MRKPAIGKLERLSLRSVWPHEAKDLTPWLRDNIGELAEALDLELGEVQREQPAGDFSIDLVAQDVDGGTVIIENQFGASDHKHLGQLVTYAASAEAKAAVWLVEDSRPEHIEAINWLNKAGGTGFYLVKLEAVRIGDSAPAPIFTLITGPSEGLAQAGEIRKESNERQRLNREWWTGLLKVANAKTPLHSGVSPSPLNYQGTSSGVRGLNLVYVTNRGLSRVELWFCGKTKEENKARFDTLAASRAGIEKAFGGPLVWERLERSKACRIKCDIPGGIDAPEAERDAIHASMVDAMVRLEKSLRPHLDKLPKA